jgi:hypothetical protein
MPRTPADINWYSGVSHKLKVSPRCPIANAELCPRYYESFWLLGHRGITTAIPKDRDTSLENKWRSFESIVKEESPRIAQMDDQLNQFRGKGPNSIY